MSQISPVTRSCASAGCDLVTGFQFGDPVGDTREDRSHTSSRLVSTRFPLQGCCLPVRWVVAPSRNRGHIYVPLRSPPKAPLGCHPPHFSRKSVRRTVTFPWRRAPGNQGLEPERAKTPRHPTPSTGRSGWILCTLQMGLSQGD